MARIPTIATALALFGIPGKVIVLTGAMQPAAFKYSDAAFNIGSAVAALQTLPEGVYLVMNGSVFDPRHAVKTWMQIASKQCRKFTSAACHGNSQ